MVCNQCQSKLSPRAKYCSECGLEVGHQSSELGMEITGELRRPNFTTGENTLSGSVRKRLELAQEGLDGSRRNVCVMFADINGFTALCEQMDPEEVTELINFYFQHLGEVIENHGGYIDKFIGDCIMAIFGAPITHDNDAELSVQAALELHSKIKELNSQRGQNLSMSIGLNYGPVVAGGVGNASKFDFTVMGDTVNLAQRYQSYADQGETCVGTSVYKICHQSFEFEKISDVEIKGKKGAQDIFRLGSVQSDKMPMTHSNNASSLLGREAELDEIQKVLKSFCSTKLSKLLMISGEAGIGKSSLIQKSIAETLKEPEVLLLKVDFGLKEKERNFAAARKIALTLLDHQSKSQLKLSEFQKQILNQLNNNQLISGDTKSHQSLIELIDQILSGLAKTNKPILILENLHCVDDQSKTCLPKLFSRLDSIQVITSIRSDYKNDWVHSNKWQTIELGSLSREDCQRLIAQQLEASQVPEDFLSHLFKLSHGNPYFLIELLSELKLSQKLELDSESRVILKDPNWQTSMPSNIQAIVSGKLDSMAEADKRLLRVASVCGENFSVSFLKELTGLDSEVDDSIHYLQNSGFIAKAPEADRYQFTDELQYQVVLESILKKKRTSLHSKIVKLLEQRLNLAKLPEEKTQIAEELATHIQLSDFELSEKLARIQRTAEIFSDCYRNVDSIRYYTSAVEEFNRQPDPGLFSWIAEIYRDLADIYLRIGSSKYAQSCIESSIQLAKRINDTDAESLGSVQMANLLIYEGQLKEAEIWIKQSVELADSNKNKLVKSLALKSAGKLKVAESDLPSAVKCFQKAYDIASEASEHEAVSEILNDLSAVLIQLQQTDNAEKILQDALAIASQFNNKELKAKIIQNMGAIELMRKDFEKATYCFQTVLTQFSEMGNLEGLAKAKLNLGVCMLKQNLNDKASEVVREALNLFQHLNQDKEATKAHKVLQSIKTQAAG